MFLDDELLEMCKAPKCETLEEINTLYKDICAKCEEYYKSKIHPLSTEKEVKIVLDRTFNLYDSFVKKAANSNDIKLQILAELFGKYSFRKQFLKNEKMAEIYYSLSK